MDFSHGHYSLITSICYLISKSFLVPLKLLVSRIGFDRIQSVIIYLGFETDRRQIIRLRFLTS